MSTIPLTSIPESLRPITHFVKIANEYTSRDVIIYYWCIYKAIEEAMKLDKQSPDALKIITSLLSTLEQLKKQHPDNEALRAEIVAQAHIEDQAKKLLTYAEQQDEQSEFNQKVIKAFYTAGYLFDVLTVFGPLDENIQSARKYAKWRAIHISQCLKKGEQPTPGGSLKQSDGNLGPPGGNLGQTGGNLSQTEAKNEESKRNEDDEELARFAATMGLPQVPGGVDSTNQFGFTSTFQQPPVPFPRAGPNNWPASIQQPGIQPPFRPLPPNASAPHKPERQQILFDPSPNKVVPQDSHRPAVIPPIDTSFSPAENLTLEDYIEAKKYTKYASSALDYEDPKTAIENMLKAISVLQKREIT